VEWTIWRHRRKYWTEIEWTPDTPRETNNLGFEGLETQAIAGLVVHRINIKPEFFTNHPVYLDLFDQVFPTIDTANWYTIKNAGLAVTAYGGTLLANEAPFQKWLRGNELALTDLEKEGAILFFGKANCGNCHNGPTLNSLEFHGYGMKNLDDCHEETFKTDNEVGENLGRDGFTKNNTDN
jgi:cytochrome c peroxidase